MQHCAGFISAQSLYMFRASSNYNTCTRGRHASFLILLMMGAWRPKHVEWLCRNKTCTVLHQVGVLFDFYYDERKHKSKTSKTLQLGRNWDSNNRDSKYRDSVVHEGIQWTRHTQFWTVRNETSDVTTVDIEGGLHEHRTKSYLSGYATLKSAACITRKNVSLIFGRVREIAVRDYKHRHVCPSVCPHGTTRRPLDGFSWNSYTWVLFENVKKLNFSLKSG